MFLFFNWRISTLQCWAGLCHTITRISHQFSSVTQPCLTLCDPMDCSTPGLPVHHQLPEFTQLHVHWVGHATQPSHALPSPSPPALNPSQHQGLCQWVSSLHQVAKVLEFQQQHNDHFLLKKIFFWLYHTSCRVLIPQWKIEPVSPVEVLHSKQCTTRDGFYHILSSNILGSWGGKT